MSQASAPSTAAPQPLTGTTTSGSGNLGLYTAVVAIWGTSWIGLKLQVGAGVEVLASVSYRFGLAALLLFGWCLLRGHSLRFNRVQHLRMVAQGFLMFTLNYFLFYSAALYLTSGLLAVASSTVILFNLVLGVLFLGQRLDARLVAGVLMGLCGIAAVFWPEVSHFSLSDTGTKGVLLALGGTVCVAFSLTLSAFNQKSGLPVLQTNAYAMAYGTALTVLLGAATGTPFSFALTPEYVGSLLYLSLVASILAFGAYLTLVGRIGPARASYASVLYPIIALGLSTVFEGYQWTPPAVLGLILVLIGNILVLQRKASVR
ncbi:DMT family transporter [Novispirillum itersonii]|uniref:Drug/metabolite transporter (DMT)-like permease n=1 Tax=Novispirillum itersonii TaxID=189 RepID=A0A7W9ZF08_NOVIT|nr:DMT family transporter [Novispirillum itersonii]MBB6209054.1 drug/metabolite transporter (DMT)-like permease [Novispirillum itersonii]